MRNEKFDKITADKNMTCFKISDCNTISCFAPACKIFTTCERRPLAQCR